MKTISKYQIFTELQHGPITWVYKAIQPELQRMVLVKQLNPDLVADQELVERFKQEGLILAKIKSPHVITIFDFGFEDGIPFLVTEFIEGNTLADLIKQKGPLPWDIGLFILQQLSRGLTAIHKQDIIHQDIKPENIFISDQGVVKLGDLGFSVALQQTDRPIQGTPAYLPPETVLGSSVDVRSDLYSLGLVGYEMLTGENPFQAEDMPIVLSRIVTVKPMNVHVVRSEVPEPVSDTIEKLLQRNPQERFPSAIELHRELERLQNSYGIKVDDNSLVSYLQDPTHYQISPITAIAKPAPAAQKPAGPKRIILTVGLVMVSILLILLVKMLGNGFSFFHKGADTAKPARDKNFTQIDNQQDRVPLVSGNMEDKNQAETPVSVAKPTRPGKTLKPNDTLDIVSLVVPEKDSIMISSDPRAVVFQSGDSIGMTPLALFIASQKEPVELELKTPGFPTIQKTVTESDLVAQKFHINLWKEVGYLDISIRPWGEIWIDGDSIDVSPINRLLILSPGNHKLRIRHPSLKSVTEFIHVAIGETLRKNIQLRPGS